MTFERIICLNMVKWKYEYFNAKKARICSVVLCLVLLLINTNFMIIFLIDYSSNLDKKFTTLATYTLWTRVWFISDTLLLFIIKFILKLFYLR